MIEELHQTLQAENIRGGWTPVNPAITVGIAEYDRHPDDQHLIQCAETALADALTNSRVHWISS